MAIGLYLNRDIPPCRDDARSPVKAYVDRLKGLLAPPTDEGPLIRHWTLDRADLAAVDRRRSAHDQLGHALQLCSFRYPGRLLRPGAAISKAALRFAAW